MNILKHIRSDCRNLRQDSIFSYVNVSKRLTLDLKENILVTQLRIRIFNKYPKNIIVVFINTKSLIQKHYDTLCFGFSWENVSAIFFAINFYLEKKKQKICKNYKISELVKLVKVII